ncbi:MAG: hypothetical protein LUG48_17035 [Klebsiella quasipneumoniae]|nr:hypothetical protein [Klebsiella quasipneumoniae]
MSEDLKKYDPEWTIATLTDALDALEDLIAEVQDSPGEVKEIIEEVLPNVYAKLNYAYHSAKDGPDALATMSDDEIISFPPVLPMSSESDITYEDEGGETTN